MSDSTPPTPPPNITEPRREWQDWFSSVYRYLKATGGSTLASIVTSIQMTLTSHIDNTSNPHHVTWAQVVETGSSVANIEQNSHTLLSDIGSNTHEEIDDFILKRQNYISNRDPVRYALLGN